jgi:hypothetical protein
MLVGTTETHPHAPQPRPCGAGQPMTHTFTSSSRPQHWFASGSSHNDWYAQMTLNPHAVALYLLNSSLGLAFIVLRGASASAAAVLGQHLCSNGTPEIIAQPSSSSSR